DILGNGLAGDGSNPGTAYTSSFNITASQYAAATVYLPQFAQGPTQAVNVPSDTEASNQTFTGLPPAIVNGARITSGQITLHFNPALLQLTGAAAPAAGIDSFTVSGIDNVHGSATIVFTSATALPAGALTLGTLGATVQDVYATAYRAKELLHLDGLTL